MQCLRRAILITRRTKNLTLLSPDIIFASPRRLKFLRILSSFLPGS